MKVTVFPLVLLASLNLPLAAHAQGTVRGAQEGAAQGAREGGPIGEVIGGAVGAVTGTIGGILGVDDRRHFHEYVARQHHPSYRYNELRVGGAGPFVDGLIPAVISRLAERHRRIEFNVTESDPPTLCRMLRERRLDLAICRMSSLMYSEDLEADSLFDEPLFVVAGLDNRWSRRRKIDLVELLDEPWTMPEQDNVAMALITDCFHSAGVTPPTPQVVSDSMATRTRLVEMGPFLTFLPGSALHFGAGRLRVKILPVALSMKAPPTQVITLKNRTPNAIARLFIDELHSIARPLKKGPRERRDASHPIKQANPAAPAKVTERRNNFAQGTTRT